MSQLNIVSEEIVEFATLGHDDEDEDGIVDHGGDTSQNSSDDGGDEDDDEDDEDGDGDEDEDNEEDEEDKDENQTPVGIDTVFVSLLLI